MLARDGQGGVLDASLDKTLPNRHFNIRTAIMRLAPQGAFVLIEYDNGQQDKRLARTLAYIERIESGVTPESRQRLDLHWIQNRDLIADINETEWPKGRTG